MEDDAILSLALRKLDPFVKKRVLFFGGGRTLLLVHGTATSRFSFLDEIPKNKKFVCPDYSLTTFNHHVEFATEDRLWTKRVDGFGREPQDERRESKRLRAFPHTHLDVPLYAKFARLPRPLQDGNASSTSRRKWSPSPCSRLTSTRNRLRERKTRSNLAHFVRKP